MTYLIYVWQECSTGEKGYWKLIWGYYNCFTGDLKYSTDVSEAKK